MLKKYELYLIFVDIKVAHNINFPLKNQCTITSVKIFHKFMNYYSFAKSLKTVPNIWIGTHSHYRLPVCVLPYKDQIN